MKMHVRLELFVLHAYFNISFISCLNGNLRAISPEVAEEYESNKSGESKNDRNILVIFVILTGDSLRCCKFICN